MSSGLSGNTVYIRHVPAGFGIEIAEGLVNFGTDHIRPGPVGVIRRINRRVFDFSLIKDKYPAVMFQFQEPGHVIDAGDPVGKLVNRDAYVFRQLGSGALHAVAKTGIFNVGVIVDCPANDGHRVGIIQQPGMGQSSSMSRQMSMMTGTWRAP